MMIRTKRITPPMIIYRLYFIKNDDFPEFNASKFGSNAE
jgi:hypothetical protein